VFPFHYWFKLLLLLPLFLINSVTDLSHHATLINSKMLKNLMSAVIASLAATNNHANYKLMINNKKSGIMLKSNI